MGKYGTNLEGFGGFEGGVNADKGAPLVSTSSDGETALLFGPAALREIQAGVANGDFAIPPDDSTATITSENPLPYWTFTDVNSAGAITCAVVADAANGSGNVLQWTVNSGTLTGKSAKITRYIPVSSTLSRTFSYYVEASFTAATNSPQSEVTVSGAFYKTDLTVASGSFTSGPVAFSSLVSTTGVTAPADFDAGSLVSTTAPADAAFLLVTITISTNATQSAARTIKLAEVTVMHGSPELLLTDRSAPQTYQPAVLQADGGELLIQNGSAATLTIGASTTNLTGGLAVVGTLTSADALIGAATIGTNGTFTGFNVNMSGAQGLRHDEPQTTTQTSSAAIWVTVSGTNRQLRRNSSSARYKTNIVDADEVVLEAARKVKPRHYESTIEDENGATRLGFIAEEIHESGLTHAVGYDAEGKPETIDPVALIAALWHRVSDLEDRLKALEQA